MKRSKEEILSKLNSILGELNNDDVISLHEDIADTFDDYERRTADSTNWEQKYKDNDEQWRKKYRERFYSSVEKEENTSIDNDIDENEKTLTYEGLFKESEK